MGLVFDTINQIIEVEAPATEITMQELINGIRDFEDDNLGMSFAKIANASGKQDLGGGVLVGITVTLIDWKLKFEDRPGPDFIICNVTGGNLVRYDTVLDQYTSPIEPAAYVTVTLTASSSATLQELAAIQYSSFNGGVTVDVTSSYSGTTYPVGTPRQPVNNFADALSILTERGFTTFYVMGDALIDVAGDYSGLIFIGESPVKSTLTISSGANVFNAEFYNAHIKGYLDGNVTLQDCLITDLNYINGYIQACILGEGTIILSGGNPAYILDCWSGVPGQTMPVLDCGGSGQAVNIRNYNGDIKLINKTGPENISIDLNSGQVELDSTITNGTIVIRGIGKVIDNSSGTTVDLTNLINPPTIATSVWSEPTVNHETYGTFGAMLFSIAGLTGENVKWSNLSFDANHNLTSATITRYTDNTLTTVMKSWTLTATYNANNELTAYQMVEN